MRFISPSVPDLVRASALLSLVAVAYTRSPAIGRQDETQVFTAHREVLIADGVHVVDGFVFSAVREQIREGDGPRAEAMVEGKAKTRAVRQILEWRLEPQVAADIGHAGLRGAVVAAALRCLEQSHSFEGLLTVHSEELDGMRQVVCAVPESRTDPIRLDRDQLVGCLSERVGSGRATVLDLLVLAELTDATASPESGAAASTGVGGRDLLEPLSRVLGPGFAMACSGRWVDLEGRILARSVEGWTGPAAAAVRAAGTCGRALAPLSESAIGALSTEDLFVLMATRIHDPNVQSAVSERLTASGFARSAAALRFPRATLHAFEDRSGGSLSAGIRARFFESPIAVTMLLADGEPGARWGGPPDCLVEATKAFNAGTLASIERSIQLLLDGMRETPSADALSLLSAALLAREEPRLAEPLARAVFLEDPEHPFAGANALRANMAIGNRNRVRDLLVRMAQRSRVGDWAREQMEEAKRWLDAATSPEGPSSDPKPPADPDIPDPDHAGPGDVVSAAPCGGAVGSI